MIGNEWPFINDRVTTISGHFFAICMFIFHKTEVSTVILRCLCCVYRIQIRHLLKLRSLLCFHNLVWQTAFHFIAARTMNFWKRIQIFLVFIFILCKVRLLPYLLGCAFFCQKFDTSSFIARQKNGPYNTGDELSSKKSKPNIWWNLTGQVF